MTLRLRRYKAEDAAQWNAFVATARSGTFLHDRRFMEYHAGRFEDHSVMIEAEGKLVAILPAERQGTLLRSHGGLTYGGILSGTEMTAARMLEIFVALAPWLRDQGLDALHYKPVPHVFHRVPAEEDLYALHQAGARPVRSDLAAVVDLAAGSKLAKSKRQGAKRAEKAGFAVSEATNFAPFWAILQARLQDAHQTLPTHSLAEITNLREAFPEAIRLFVSGAKAECPEAGAVVFDCGTTVHVQYMATTDAGRRDGGLDAVLVHLLSNVFCNRRFFSFGISTEDQGKTLNVGLARQKEMFGARGVVFPQYHWDLA